MFDPVTISAAVATASTAFNGIKRAFAAGRDFESMAGDLSRWMGAVSDVDAAHKSANNPSMLRKVLSAKSIEEEAIEAFAAKKQLEQQRNEFVTKKRGETKTNPRKSQHQKRSSDSVRDAR